MRQKPERQIFGFQTADKASENLLTSSLFFCSEQLKIFNTKLLSMSNTQESTHQTEADFSLILLFTLYLINLKNQHRD